MVNWTLLWVFIPTFFFVSLTPGMCMTLALVLGMTVGVKRSLWMMAGELVGVGLVAVAAVLGVAAIMLQFPSLFWLLKIAGGSYLFYLGYELLRSRGRMALSTVDVERSSLCARELMLQGFVTAVANPKGWAFFIALMPPFISVELPLFGQLLVWISIILLLEFGCLLIYASGGQSLRHLLDKPAHVKTLNRVAGALMIGVSLWLVLG